MTNASIYPALHALEADGFITHDSVIHNGRARKIYYISESGKNDLHKWLLEFFHEKPCFRDQLLLKVVMQSDETIRYARGWIAESLESLRSEITAYESNMSTIVSTMETTGRHQTLGLQLAHEYGFEMLRLRVRLLEMILAMTQNPNVVTVPESHPDESRSASI